MCKTCGGLIGIPQQKVAENAAKIPAAQQFANVITGLVLGGTEKLGLFGYGFNEETTEVTSSNREERKEAVEEAKEEKPVDTSELQKDVEIILGKDEFNKLSADMQKDILNKYDAYKSVLKLEGTALSDRVKTYVKALQAHKIELEMGAYNEKLFNEALKEVAADPKAPTDEELEQAKALVLQKMQECDIKIQDDNIETQRKTGTDEEYFGALQSRGVGYVDMYDKNNDEVISFEEFKVLEEKDSGKALTPEEVEMTREFFNKIDKDNNGIDANEMASHLYAMSRMHDKSEQGAPNTVADITFGEWLDSQKILTNEKVLTRYNNIYNQLYGVLKPKE